MTTEEEYYDILKNFGEVSNAKQWQERAERLQLLLPKLRKEASVGIAMSQYILGSILLSSFHEVDYSNLHNHTSSNTIEAIGLLEMASEAGISSATDCLRVAKGMFNTGNFFRLS